MAVKCAVCERSDLWLPWPDRTTLSITNDGTGSRLLLSHTLFYCVSPRWFILRTLGQSRTFTTSKCQQVNVLRRSVPNNNMWSSIFGAFLRVLLFFFTSVCQSLSPGSFSNDLPCTIYYRLLSSHIQLCPSMLDEYWPISLSLCVFAQCICTHSPSRRGRL